MGESFEYFCTGVRMIWVNFSKVFECYVKSKIYTNVMFGRNIGESIRIKFIQVIMT